MRINQETQELIKHFESLRLVAYQDTGKVWTIGWGHTGKMARRGITIDVSAAEMLFREDVEEAEKSVDALVDVDLNENQFGALVSFVFNLGHDQFSKSTLRKKLNARQYEAAAKQFPRWVYDDGKKLEGLVRRRLAEQTLFLKPPAPKLPT